MTPGGSLLTPMTGYTPMGLTPEKLQILRIE